MNTFDDLTGMTFGNWKVIKRVENYAKGMTVWRCRCSCGTLRDVLRISLKSGKSKSCGCIGHSIKYNPGQIVGGFKIISKTTKKYCNQNVWKVQCLRCKSIVERGQGVFSGKFVQTCGCLRKKSPGESGANLLFKTYKWGAAQRGIVFTLTREQFLKITKENCKYCGSPPNQVSGSSRKINGHNGNYIYNGVDRVNNLEGYTIENSVSACGDCNRIKSSDTYKDFIRKIEKIFLHTRT
jgi:hypothetical protein